MTDIEMSFVEIVGVTGRTNNKVYGHSKLYNLLKSKSTITSDDGYKKINAYCVMSSVAILRTEDAKKSRAVVFKEIAD